MTASRILLTGSSGLIGTSVVRVMQQKRISTISLNRKNNRSGLPDSGGFFWDPYVSRPMDDPQAVAGISGVVHLSGANLASHRWTPAYKREILESRVKPTRALALMMAALRPKPSVMVCASAIGIYGSRGNEELTESATPGSGFLPEICLAWEKAAQPAVDAGIRVVHARFGVVLAQDGGALKQMLPIFRLGLGGRLGSGRQWLSWVALPDAVRAILFALDTNTLAGPVNIVAPRPVTNHDFTRILGRVLHRPAFLAVPTLALRLAFGEMASATILGSERVVPARLQDAGFTFEHPELESGLRAVLSRGATD